MVVDTISQNKMLRQVSSRLHPQWWSKLDLEVLQSAREHNQLVSKRLDNVILSRSGCQSVWLSECSEEMNKWLSVLPRISLLATAAGLLSQNCPDYLWDSSYRSVLRQKFTQPQIEQLIALWPVGSEPPAWSANNVLEQAELFSASAIYHLWSDQPFWSLFRLSLPVFDTPIALAQDDIERVESWIFRLERFL
ncbi:type III secretion system domain-containing protein [Vibrio coralliilyticus]|uniref:type III secretion system domain-containing protein n=1 Tax=Vibrio coralliilyticus TaxID=190893 RepID=UPI00155F6639|nr:type III secretion system domain-containing protein [Vibrio coralliilyticus]NRF16124.1 hypothetical protein [Vibrio coralliilyticus]